MRTDGLTASRTVPVRRLVALCATAMSACMLAGCGWIADVVSQRVDAADYFSPPTVRLLDAARRDDQAQIRSLAAADADLDEQGGDPDTDPRRENITPLQWAVEFERPTAVAALLRAGADPHRPGAGRYNAVAYSVLLDRFPAFRTFIEFDAGLVEASDRIGGNVVHTAVRHRRGDALRLLIDRGADLDSVQPLAGRTPLFTAADVLNIDHCLILLRAGADGAHRDQRGATFLPSLYTADDSIRTGSYLRTRAAIESEMRARDFPIETGR
ncbi:ankyrin repeat domain-containing protein [Gordonia sp. 'Campus']|uniref:ankyrin repeat domain-containing protein n=1 Tax=Gordonia sp. 'Campus' TaxID=2915824 RepID=UPI001EE4B053|nr:ankyrin repeat domain-containing protein [Gordonia sp. 'Campus']